MTFGPDGQTARSGQPRPTRTVDTPLPGQAPLVGAALAIGILLMGIQLWLLTIALELLLAGNGPDVWLIAVASGIIFLGGLGVLWILRRRPRLRQPTGDEIPYAASAWGSPGTGDR